MPTSRPTVDSFLTLLPSEPAPHLSFREYMDTCMFDASVGYYGGGKVTIGLFQDFWTYPVRMSPVFGELLSLRVVDLWRALRSELESGDHPFHVVEVGGGHGVLLRDVLDGLQRRAHEDPEVAELLSRVALVAVDRSQALLADQRAAQAALEVRHINAPANALSKALPQPFFGLIFANELLDTLAVELLRVEREGASRLRVLPWCDKTLADLTADGPDLPGGGERRAFRPLAQGNLSRLIGALESDEALLRRFASGNVARWTGVLEPLDPAAGDRALTYVARSQPAVDPLAAEEALPAWVCFAPGAVDVLDELAAVLSSGAGAFFTIDYGGTGYHVFDNTSRFPHLRTYSRLLDGDPTHDRKDEYRDKVHNPFRSPGCEDITADIDFTWLAEALERRGLELAYYGFQGALEADLDLWRKPHQTALVQGRLDEGYSGAEAVLEAHRLLNRFRSGAGFRLLAMTSPGLSGTFPALGPSDRVRYRDLPRTPSALDTPTLISRIIGGLQASGLSAERAEKVAERCVGALHATGSVVDDLDDAGLYRWRKVVIDALSQTAPG